MYKKKLKWFGVVGIILLMFFTAAIGVLADDDDDYEHEEFERRDYYQDDHEGYEDEEYEDDDDDEEHGYGEDYNQGYERTVPSQTGYWNFWVREAISSQDTNLPITQPSEVTVKVNGIDVGKIQVVPQEGQILVPGKKVAEFLGAKTEYYPKSRILVMTKATSELIVRAGSNAAFENKNKTPMPMQAQYIETSLYLPVSVVANALGYRVSWNEAENSLMIDNI